MFPPPLFYYPGRVVKDPKFLQLAFVVLAAGLVHVPSSTVSALEHLGDGPPAASLREDAYGDSIPPQAMARLGTVRLRQADTDFVTAVAFSPGGDTLASAGGVYVSLPGFSRTSGLVDEDGSYLVRLWNVNTGKDLGIRLFTASPTVPAIAFSPDGKHLVSGGYPIRLFDLVDGKRIRTFEGSADGIAWSPDGKSLAIVANKKPLRVLDVATGKTLCKVDGKGGLGTQVHFSPDGKVLAWVGVDGTVHAYDPRTNLPLWQGGHDKSTSLAFAPDSQTLASSGGDQTIRFWDTRAGKELLELRRQVGRGCFKTRFGMNSAAGVGEGGQSCGTRNGC